MDVQSLKRWHWILIGVICGAALGWAQLAARESAPVGGVGFISQAVFERDLRLPPVAASAEAQQPIWQPKSRGRRKGNVAK